MDVSSTTTTTWTDLLTVRARTRAEFDDNLNSLRNYLRELGWNVTPNGKYFNSHITKPGYNATIDLFGLWA